MAQRFTVGTNYLSASTNLPDANSDYTCMGYMRIVSSPAGTSAEVWRHHFFSFGGGDQDRLRFVDFGFGLALFATFAVGATEELLIAGGLSDGTLYHVATVREGTAVRLYIDGSLVDDGTHDASSRTDPDAFDVCKADEGGAGNEIDVEGLKFFQRALTAEQIAVEMKRTMPVGPDCLNAWPFVGQNGVDHRGSCPMTLTGTLGAAEPVGVQFRAASTDVLVWPPVAGGVTDTIEVPNATLTLVEQVPALLDSIPVPSATLTLVEQVPALLDAIPVPNATLTLVEQVPSLLASIPVPNATLTLVGQVPDLVTGVPVTDTIEVPSAVLRLSGAIDGSDTAPTLSYDEPRGVVTVGELSQVVSLRPGDEFYLAIEGPAIDEPMLVITLWHT